MQNQRRHWLPGVSLRAHAAGRERRRPLSPSLLVYLLLVPALICLSNGPHPNERPFLHQAVPSNSQVTDNPVSEEAGGSLGDPHSSPGLPSHVRPTLWLGMTDGSK